MTHLDLTDDDARLLRELLKSALLDLRREIAHTDSREFRHTLVERQEGIERLLQGLPREASVL